LISRYGIALAGLVSLMAASGASCPQMVRQYTEPLPRALPPEATLAQLATVINDNTARVQSFSAARASVSTPGFPPLHANVVYERDRRFRLRADTVLTGPEVDFGSNDELFWFWVRRNTPPAMFYCRHEQFAGSAAQRVMPIEPQWLVEALGLVRFLPQDQPQGPFPVGSGRLEIRTTRGDGPSRQTRITIIDDSRGIVLQHNLYDSRGMPLATAQLSKHMRDITSGAIMPHHVDIQCPPAKFEISLDLGDVEINHVDGNPQELWTKPDYPGFPNVDLATLVMPSGGPAGPSGAMPQAGMQRAPFPQAGMPQGYPQGAAPQAPLPGYSPVARRPGPQLPRRF